MLSNTYYCLPLLTLLHLYGTPKHPSRGGGSTSINSCMRLLDDVSVYSRNLNTNTRLYHFSIPFTPSSSQAKKTFSFTIFYSCILSPVDPLNQYTPFRPSISSKPKPPHTPPQKCSSLSSPLFLLLLLLLPAQSLCPLPKLVSSRRLFMTSNRC